MLSLLAVSFFLLSSSNSAPLSRRTVDLTYVFDETTPYYPIYKPFEMNVLSNGTDTPGFEGIWLQFEEYSAPTHVGTHMDAPAHFVIGGQTIDQIPVSNLIAPAAVVDITAKAEQNPDAEATVDDLLSWESTTGQNLNGTILLLRSGWGRKWNNRTAYSGSDGGDVRNLHFPGLGATAAQWLVDNRKILGIGVDTLSFDNGISRDFSAHKILLSVGVFGLENVANMEKLPIYGATLHVMPMKIGNASGAPTRIVATFPEVMFQNDLPRQ